MKLLIEIPTWLGDAVMCTPVIQNIITNFNNPEVTIIGSLSSIELFENNKKIKNTFVVEKNNLHINSFAKSLGEFDLFISFRGSFRSKLLQFFVLSKKKYQFNKNSYKGLHQVEKYNNFVNNSLNVKFSAGRLKLYPSSRKSNFNNSKLTLGINPGASYGNAKQWRPERFAEVASVLSSSYEIIIFGGPDEKKISGDIEKLLVEKGVTNFKNLAGITTVQDLIDRISCLDLFITGDSGPMHIAASFQIPTVAIFGPTNDTETSQWMLDKSIIVKKELDCQPCMQRTCPLGHHDCMNLVKVKDILVAIKTIN
jgi:heptosyltransferase-2